MTIPPIWDLSVMLCINSDGGCIDNFRWINSWTEPHHSALLMGTSVISWGGWCFGLPEPGVMLNGSDYLIVR